MKQRLIWNKEDPAPFESGWSLFAKAVLLNRLRLPVVFELISCDGVAPSSHDHTGKWIDFKKFSSLVLVPQETLRQSFLDTLGFEGVPTAVGIRHCPQCLAMGYHCVFFQWVLMSKCPIHDVDLQKPCISCAFELSALALHRRGTRGTSIKHAEFFVGDKYQSTCMHLKMDYDAPVSLERLSQPEQNGFKKFGQEMLSWRRRLHKSHLSAYEIVSDLTLYSDQAHVPYLLGIMKDVAQEIPMPVMYPYKKGTLLTWFSKSNNVELRGDGQEAIKIKKSISRHIFKRYIKERHKQCANELMSLSHMQAQLLSRLNVCTICLAYASWVMAEKRLVNVESFRNGRSIRRRNSGRISASESSAWAHSYFVSFFYWLDEIDINLECGDLRIDLAQSHVGEHSLMQRQSFMANRGERYWLILPWIEGLIKRASGRCLRRAQGRSTMLVKESEELFKVNALQAPERGTMFTICTDYGYGRTRNSRKVSPTRLRL